MLGNEIIALTENFESHFMKIYLLLLIFTIKNNFIEQTADFRKIKLRVDIMLTAGSPLVASYTQTSVARTPLGS